MKGTYLHIGLPLSENRFQQEQTYPFLRIRLKELRDLSQGFGIPDSTDSQIIFRSAT